jgi:hypothetical protein
MYYLIESSPYYPHVVLWKGDSFQEALQHYEKEHKKAFNPEWLIITDEYGDLMCHQCESRLEFCCCDEEAKQKKCICRNCIC